MKSNIVILIVTFFSYTITINISYPTNRTQLEINLRNWLQENGAYINPKLKIQYLFKDNRYIIAGDDIQKGEYLVIIPDPLIIRSHKQSKTNQCIDKLMYDSQSCMAYFVCTQLKNPKSFFKPFLDFLPNDFHTYPYFYPPEQKKLLANTKVEFISKEWDIAFQKDLSILKNKTEITFDEYSKCRHIVWSRNFMKKVQDKPENFVVPYADLFNYSPNQINTNTYYNSTSDSKNKSLGKFIIEARDSIPKGKEIFVFYGEKPNEQYLFSYGFTLENNPTKVHYDFASLNLENPPEIATCIWIFRKTNSNQISKERTEEIEALNALKNKIEVMYNGYTNRFNPGEEAHNLNFTMTNIYRVVIEEKKLLKDYIEAIDACLRFFANFLTSGRSSLRKYAEKNRMISPRYINLLLSAYRK